MEKRLNMHMVFLKRHAVHASGVHHQQDAGEESTSVPWPLLSPLWRNDSTCTHTNPMQPGSHRDSHTRTDPAHTNRTTSTATHRATYTCPIMTSALALQSQHRNANPAPAR